VFGESSAVGAVLKQQLHAVDTTFLGGEMQRRQTLTVSTIHIRTLHTQTAHTM